MSRTEAKELERRIYLMLEWTNELIDQMSHENELTVAISERSKTLHMAIRQNFDTINAMKKELRDAGWLD